MRIGHRLDDDRALGRQRLGQLLSASLWVLDPETATAACLRELDEVDGRHLDSVLRVAEEDHLLPLDHAQHVVLQDDDLHGEAVLDAGRELGHEHLHATVADERDALPARVGDLGGHRVRQPAGHRGEGPAERETLAPADAKHLGRPDGDRSRIAADDGIFREHLAELPRGNLRLHGHRILRAALLHQLPPVARSALRVLEECAVAVFGERGQQRLERRACVADQPDVGRHPQADAHRVVIDLHHDRLAGPR